MRADVVSPRWLIVVRADRPELVGPLREGMAANDRVEVVLDRRRGDRRQSRTPVGRERRRRPRRKALSAQARALWEDTGFRFAPAAPSRRRGGGTDGHESRADGNPGLPQPDGRTPAPGGESAGEAPVTSVPAEAGAGWAARDASAPGDEPRSLAPGAWRLYLLRAWLDACLDALRSERLDLCRSHLALAIGLSGDGSPDGRDREVAHHGEGASMLGSDPGVPGRD